MLTMWRILSILLVVLATDAALLVVLPADAAYSNEPRGSGTNPVTIKMLPAPDAKAKTITTRCAPNVGKETCGDIRKNTLRR